MLTVKEAADRMHVSTGLVYALCAHRQLRHSRVGLGRGKIVISEEAVAEYLEGRESGPEPPKPPPPPRRIKLENLQIPS
jgi:excisionase family DNA binding protein